MFGAMKQKIIDNATSTVVTVLKRDIIALLGEDAREEDIDVINQYFDGGTALTNVKEALTEAGIL